MSRGGIGAVLSVPTFAGMAASIVEIKSTISRLVGVDPALACPDLFQAPTEKGDRPDVSATTS